MYIAIEGLQGTGKSTLVNLLKSWLSAKSIDFDLLCPNQPMANDHWLEQKALLPQFSDRDEFRALLHTTRADYHQKRVDFKKRLVIGDQSIFSNIAAQWHRSAELGMKSYVNQIYRREYNLPWPDHIVMLSMPIDTLRDQLATKHNTDQGKNLDINALNQQLQTTHHAFTELEKNADFLGFGHVKWHHANITQPFHDLVECIGSYIIKQLEMSQETEPNSKSFTV